VRLCVDFAGLVWALELSEPEHLCVAANQGTVDGLDLEAGVPEGGLDGSFVEPLGVRHFMVHAGIQ